MSLMPLTVQKLANAGIRPTPDELLLKGFEVDLVISVGTQVCGVEIKSAMTYRRSLAENLRTFVAEDPNVTGTALVYDGADIPSADGKDPAVSNFRTLSI